MNDEKIEHIIKIADSIKPTDITLLTGANASGKSLIRKLLNTNIGKGKVLPHASQELRTSNDFMGMTRDLNWLATSYTTIGNIEKVITENANYFVIDEPEIGCGEELQLGLARYINELILSKKVKGCLIITHSRIMVKHLNYETFINIEGMSKSKWLTRKPIEKNIQEFKKESNELFTAIQDRINKNKKNGNSIHT